MKPKTKAYRQVAQGAERLRGDTEITAGIKISATDPDSSSRLNVFVRISLGLRGQRGGNVGWEMSLQSLCAVSPS